MEQQLIGRKKELKLLKEYINSDKSEFVAVYGRRRVGKTFLIRKSVGDEFSFFVTGVHGAAKSEQLINFAIALQKYSCAAQLSVPKNWILAFYELSRYLESLPAGKKVIFIDELPWMDTAKSGFIAALENFWNSWAVLRNDVKLIVCGSATSWMINNLIRNRGGLHNRLTHHLVLEPFTLCECEEYFKAFGFSFARKQIAECYMIMGGIPYYLSMMEKSKSLAQNIDLLFFSKNAPLKDEFNDLYRALFKNASPHIEVVTALAGKGMGLTRQELLNATGLADNGAFSTVIEELEHCGFVRLYLPFGHSAFGDEKRLQRNTIIQLVDFYTLFYFNFVRNNRYQDEHFWTTSLNSSLHSTWSGFSFEMLCLNHLNQIKQALGISGVQTLACSWHTSSGRTHGAQIDLLIDRKDDTINVCEMKFAKGEFEISKAYEKSLMNKLDVFLEESKTRKSLLMTMITTHGVKSNAHSGVVQSEVVLDDLFV
ncbi:MAG: AAA family ATPase [Bacteroides sp.]|nr:AAA family ATPase [Bacteroides sp.]